MVNDDAFLLKQIEYEVWSALRKTGWTKTDLY